jgi:transposase-like protein
MTPETFWTFVDKSGQCWLWTGATNGDGRGRIRFDGRMQYAYRVAWELTHGAPIPADREACHTCDNPICVNPVHIFSGTRLDNMQDAAAKGRIRVPAPRYALDHHMATVPAALVAQAVEEYLAGDETQARVAARYGVSQTTLSLWVGAKVRPDAGLTSRRKPLKPCGTHAAYARHIRRGEKACEACLQAERDHCTAQRAKRIGSAA